MRRPLVAGNWPMVGSRAANAPLVAELVQASFGGGVDVVVCPPCAYLWEVGRQLKDSRIGLGAQDVCAEAGPGAFTGEVSAAMLKDVGCGYAIVGHSERRALYREDDALVARKFVAAQAQGLVPILCVGETLDEREKGVTSAVVARQLDAVLGLAGVAAFARAIVAYEPVWAIGTGKNATPDQAQDVHAFVRGRIADRDATIGAGLRVLYGGSVKAANAAELFAMADVDGGLVGGASLKSEEFVRICAAAA
ncbi:MAG: triose-phosphate isomerase [Acidobacteriota bacterium]